MRNLAPFSTYTRAAIKATVEAKKLGDSTLGYLAASEYGMISHFANLSEPNKPFESVAWRWKKDLKEDELRNLHWLPDVTSTAEPGL